MINDPSQLIDWRVPVRGLDGPHEVLRGLIVIGVEPEGPPVRGHELDGLDKLGLGDGRGRDHILREIGRVVHGPDHILARANHPEMIVALAGLHLRNPRLVVVQLLAGALREQ